MRSLKPGWRWKVCWAIKYLEVWSLKFKYLSTCVEEFAAYFIQQIFIYQARSQVLKLWEKNGTQLHPLEIRNIEGKTWENTIEWPVRTEVLKAGLWLYFVCCWILGPRISTGTHRGSINICGIKNLRNDHFYPIIRLFLDMMSFSHFLVYLHICELYCHFTAS